MALELYPHQAQVSQAVERMLADKGRAAVILPTGTGKSYIAFHLIEQHPEAAFLWLAPSEYIFRTQRESLRRTNPELSLENVTFCTYASLIYRTPEGIAGIVCDYIILDEFHRCGSEHWGAAVQMLLASHPQSKLLGLSATHIRYLDHQRNMAEELLDNCIAAEMTLGEAIVRGILPAPKYVTTVYQDQKNLTLYEAWMATQRFEAKQCLPIALGGSGVADWPGKLPGHRSCEGLPAHRVGKMQSGRTLQEGVWRPAVSPAVCDGERQVSGALAGDHKMDAQQRWHADKRTGASIESAGHCVGWPSAVHLEALLYQGKSVLPYQVHSNLRVPWEDKRKMDSSLAYGNRPANNPTEKEACLLRYASPTNPVIEQDRRAMINLDAESTG